MQLLAAARTDNGDSCLHLVCEVGCQHPTNFSWWSGVWTCEEHRIRIQPLRGDPGCGLRLRRRMCGEARKPDIRMSLSPYADT